MTKSRVIHFFAALTFVAVAAPVSSAAADVPDAKATAAAAATTITVSGPATARGVVSAAREDTPTGRCVACW